MIEFELKRIGIVIVISAPSGGGKSSIIKALLERDASLTYSISATTRPPRKGEASGREYFFHQSEEFQRLVDEGAFYEHALVHGNYYGTPKEQVDRLLGEGKDVILDLDVQGSLNLKKVMPGCISIFVLPPSMATLEKRLRSRASDAEEVIQRRLENAREEVKIADQYDYVLVNQDLEATIENVRTIIAAQRFKSTRLIVKDGTGSVVSPAAGGL